MGVCFSQKKTGARTPGKKRKEKSQAKALDTTDAESGSRGNPARSPLRATSENQLNTGEEQLITDALPEEGSSQTVPHSSYKLKEQLLDSSQKSGDLSQTSKFPMASKVPLFPVSASDVKLTFPLPFSAGKSDPYNSHKEISLKIAHGLEGIHMERRIKLSEAAESLYESVRKELKSPRKFSLLYMGRVIPEDQRAIGEFRIWESGAVSLIVME